MAGNRISRCKIGHADFPEETYSIHLQPDLNISAEDIADAEDTFTLVDTRKYLTEYLPGHIPGAVHIPWEKFIMGITGSLFPRMH
ncbi:MAG: rhodanese-like domain-containing protein [Desulfobacterales bacterium]